MEDLMKDIVSGIYCIINTESGKPYVGSGINFNKRRANHFSKLKSNIHRNNHLQNSYNYYGKDKFIFEIIEYIENINNLSKKEFGKILTDREDYWINFYHSNDPDFGYNIRKIATSNLGIQYSEEACQKMSKNHADFNGNKNPLVKWLNKDIKNKDEYSKKCIQTWSDPKNYETLCQSNRKNIVKAMLNGNHHPYSNCDHGWITSQKFKNKFYYQSSYEKRFVEFCEMSSKIGSLQRMPFVIPYVDSKGKIRNYFADFLVNQKIVIEIKPKSMLSYNNNQFKIDAGKKYCLEHGYEYKLLMENELNNLENEKFM
jgi:group I intron endonuclease